MDSFHLLPVGSIYAREERASLGYLDTIQNMPIGIKNMIASTETASYIKGLGRTYDIPEESQPSISFAILEIALGKKKFDQLPGILSNELQLPNDKAQDMASEIERDIFGPIKKEWAEFLIEPKQNVAPNALRLTPLAPPKPQNILNLKELGAAKKQEQLSAKKSEKLLPLRSSPSQPISEQRKRIASAPSKLPLPSRPVTPPKPPSSPVKPLSFI